MPALIIGEVNDGVLVTVVVVVLVVTTMFAAVAPARISKNDILWLTSESLLTLVSSVGNGLRFPSLSAIASKSCQVSSAS